MARNTAATRARLLEAAVEEFSAYGPAGARVDRIAARAGVNKERIYGYFGSKEQLFAQVLSDELSRAAAAVSMEANSPEDIGEIAGRTFDYHEAHPHLVRLLHWEGLTNGHGLVPDEHGRQASYQAKVAAFCSAQRAGAITRQPDADLLVFLVLAIAAWWFAVPQVARMLAPPGADPAAQRDRRRAAVVAAATLLATPRPG